jgi:hypothetical protein
MPLNPSSEETRRHGVEELEALKGRVLIWRESYCRSAPPGGGSEYLFLCNEFNFEIEEYLYPYVRRMIITEHIDQEQAAEFMDFCFQQVREFQAYLMEGEEPPTA